VISYTPGERNKNNRRVSERAEIATGVIERYLDHGERVVEVAHVVGVHPHEGGHFEEHVADHLVRMPGTRLLPQILEQGVVVAQDYLDVREYRLNLIVRDDGLAASHGFLERPHEVLMKC